MVDLSREVRNIQFELRSKQLYILDLKRTSYSNVNEIIPILLDFTIQQELNSIQLFDPIFLFNNKKAAATSEGYGESLLNFISYFEDGVLIYDADSLVGTNISGATQIRFDQEKFNNNLTDTSTYQRGLLNIFKANSSNEKETPKKWYFFVASSVFLVDLFKRDICYNGSKCEYDQCKNYCKNDGICEEDVATVKCKCSNSRYIGNQCEIDLCKNKEQQQNCIEDNCILTYNQTTENCQCHCSSICSSIYCNSNGKCEKSKCNCYKGFFGEICEFKTKSKSIDIDDELIEDENNNDKQNNKKSKNIALILVLTLVLFSLSFIVVSFIFHKRLIFKRQFQARQFYNNDEFDEFNLNMENIEIRDPIYRKLKNEDDEQVNNNFEDTIQNDENINLINESKKIINTSIDDYPATSSTSIKDKTNNKPIYITKPKKLKSKSPHNINI